MKKVFLLTALFLGGVTVMSAQTQLQQANKVQDETLNQQASEKKAAEMKELQQEREQAKVKGADAIRKNDKVSSDQEKENARKAIRQEQISE